MTIRVKVLGGFVALAFAALSGPALGIDEVEPNDLHNLAQPLSQDSDPSVMRDGATVKGALAEPTFFPDVDFYSFYATDTQKLTLELQVTDINGFTPVLTVVSPSKKVHAVKVPDFTGEREVRLDDLLLNETGMWSVVVTPFQVLIGNPSATDVWELFHEGSFLYQPVTGSYTLALTPAVSPLKQIGIEVKPGSGEWAPINPKAKGVIPVALLASGDFNPFDIVESSLRFGATGVEATLRRCAAGGQDVDGDGDLDRVCTFESKGTNFNAMSTMGVLKGSTTSGTQFQGQGFLKVVPAQGSM